MFVHVELEIDNEEVVIYFINQPSGVLAPVEGKCDTFLETYGSDFFFCSLFPIFVFICLFINC